MLSIDETTEISAFLRNLDDIQLMRLDTAVQKAQAAGDLIPDDLSEALLEEVAARSREATREKNSKGEPALAILWYLHVLERNRREATN